MLSKVMLTLALACFAVSDASDEKCNKDCQNYYYNCNPGQFGLESDKPDEKIDCEENKYKLRCPLLCGLCTPCDFQQEIEEVKEQVKDCGCNEMKFSSEKCK